MQNDINPPALPFTIADLDRLIDRLSVNAKQGLPDDDSNSSVNASRIMYRFWLKSDDETDQALMQWIALLKKHRKFQTFVRLAIRAAIFEVKERYDMSDKLFIEMQELFEKLDWSKE